MAGNEHLMFAEEPSYGAWTTPTKALPVSGVTLKPVQPLMIPAETGGGRGHRAGSRGEMAVDGDVITSLYPTVLPFLLRTMFATRTAIGSVGLAVWTSRTYVVGEEVTSTASTHFFRAIVGGAAGVSEPTWILAGGQTTDGAVTWQDMGLYTAPGGGHRNILSINDDIAIDTISFQKRYNSTLAESVRGAKLDTITIDAKTKAFAQCQLAYLAKESVLTGQNWQDGSPAPAVVDPVPYPGTFIQAYRFYEGVVKLGGTVTKDGNGELQVAAPLSWSTFDNIQLVIKNNLGKDGYGVNVGDRTRQSIDEGAREIDAKFDPNFDLSRGTFYDDWLAGVDGTLQLYFRQAGGFTNEMIWTIPLFRTADAPLPELNATYGLKRHTVAVTGFTDAGTGLDIGLAVQSTEDLTV